MKIDFSSINLQYLIQARDLAREDADRAATLLGVSPDLVGQLAQLSPGQLGTIARIKAPLIHLRGDAWWWSRLFTALTEGCPAEVDAVLEQANLVMLA